jgi:FkbM family methyltransferase
MPNRPEESLQTQRPATMDTKAAAASAACVRAKAAGGVFAGLHLLSLRTCGVISRLLGMRGMQRCTWALARYVFGSGNSAVLEMASGARLKIRLGDGYWTRLLVHGYVYEPEIWWPLARVLRDPSVFVLDCGANIGYWSTVCSQFLEPGRILAVEALPPNYAQLSENAKLNDGKFQTVWGALWERDGENVVIVGHELRHAGSSIVDRRDKIGTAGYRQYNVATVTIDSLCERYVSSPEAKIVIKLDVEGAEIGALRGARKVFSQRQALILYEDHGQDKECRVSDFVMGQLGAEVYYFSEAGDFKRMRSLADVRSVKVEPDAGYNFVAFSPGSSFADLFIAS